MTPLIRLSFHILRQLTMSSIHIFSKFQILEERSFFLKFFDFYSSPRQYQIMERRTYSDTFSIVYSDFQDTFRFSPNVIESARCAEGNEQIFANDSNNFQEIHRLTASPECKAKLSKYEIQVHDWGQKNRMRFDASENHTMILHRSSMMNLRPSCWRTLNFRF